MPTEFFAFDLLISRPWPGGRAYRAHLVRSPAGEAKGKLRWPRRAALQKLLANLDHAGGGAVRAGVLGPRAASRAVRDVVRARTRESSLEGAQAADLGKILFQFLLPAKIQQCLRKSLAVAPLHQAGLALRLHFSAVPELAALPWEHLFDPQNQQFLVQSADVEVARTLERDPSLIQPPAAKLRILVVAANPFNDLKLASEVLELKKLERRFPRIKVDILTSPTWLELQRILHDRQFDVVHFAGHGSFRKSDGGGELALEREGGGHEWIPANRLASILKNHPGLRLVVLNSCKSGQLAPSAPLPGVAEALILHKIRSAVAMQAPISDGAAIAFSRSFYEAYADTRSIAHAMDCGRTACGAEWPIPCLFTREGAIVPPSLPILVIMMTFVPFLLCMFLHFYPRSCHTLEISYPQESAKVEQTETIVGTTCHLPPAQDPWVVVYSFVDNKYYPHPSKAEPYAGGHWVSRATAIGGQQDGGKNFLVLAVLADTNGGQILADAKYGLNPPLPSGVKTIREIKVTRRN